MNYQDFWKMFDGDYDKYKFTNKHEEKFILIRTRTKPKIWFIAGDETDWELVRLFNSGFDVFSDEELLSLADGITRIIE